MTKSLSHAEVIAFSAFLLLAFSGISLSLGRFTFSSVQAKSNSMAVNSQGRTGTATNTTTYEWQQQGGNPERDCFQQGTAPNSSHVLWKKQFLAILHPPIISNGKVIVAASLHGKTESPQGFLCALDENSGNIIWVTNMTDPLYSGWPYGNQLMKIDDGHFMYVHDANFSIYDLETGRLLLNFKAGNYLGIPGVFAPELKTWFGVGSFTKYLGQTIEAWNFSDITAPRMTWRSEPLEEVDPRVFYENGRIHVGSYDYSEYCFDAKTGEILWQEDMKGLTSYYGASGYGKIFRGSIDNYLWALDPATGKVLWEFRPADYGGFSGCIAVAYGRVYSMNIDGYLYAVNANDGRLAWKYRAFEPNSSQPSIIPSDNTYGAVADGKVYWLLSGRSIIAPNSGSVAFACLNTSTGKEIWQSSQAEMMAPAIADGRLYGQDWIYDMNTITSDPKIANGTGAYVWCFGKGQIRLNIGTDTRDLYDQQYITQGGETSIVGNATDLSPANLGAPAKKLPVKLVWQLPDGRTGEIGNAFTDENGKLFFKWKPPASGNYTIFAESAGNDDYEAPSTTTTTITVNPASYTPVLLPASIAVIVITVILIAAFSLRKRWKR